MAQLLFSWLSRAHVSHESYNYSLGHNNNYILISDVTDVCIRNMVSFIYTLKYTSAVAIISDRLYGM